MLRTSSLIITALSALSLSYSAYAATSPDRVILPDNAVPVSYDLTISPHATDKTFVGKISITVNLKKAAQDISFNAADLKFSKVSLVGTKDSPKLSYDEKSETETLHFSTALKAGPHVLQIDYSGKIYDSAAGLFALPYETAGKKHVALYTQFENSDARRFMPCWDEPGIKAVYHLSAILPKDEMAVSNMPVAETKDMGKDYKIVRFAPTPKMSSYLLFYAQGDFERVHHMVDGVDVGVIVKRGDMNKASYALDTASKVLPYYNAYFGTKYPLPKMDLIAAPGGSQFFSAMENWGAIFYFERAVLFDPKNSSESDKRRVFITIAHEMAHQWFGDLVTMAWWDNLWLNEGFASWMENKAADHFNPNWHVWRDAVRGSGFAMDIDSKPGTHPIIQDIKDVAQASQAFDAITYVKGQSVIRMLESYIGEQPFRDGVRAYIKKHAYANTVSDDLWTEMDKTTKVPVSEIAHDFTLNPGVPLVKAEATKGGMKLSVLRFHASGAKPSDVKWHVPVVITDLKGKEIWRGQVTPGADQTVAVPEDVTAIINPGHTGYYRVQYGPKLMVRLAGHFSQLSPTDQMALMSDSAALGGSGDLPVTASLALTGAVGPHFDPQVQAMAASRFSGLDTNADGLDFQPLLRAYAIRHLQPMLDATGWDAKAGEDGNVAQLRPQLISALGRFGDKAVISEARKRFAAYQKDRSVLRGGLRQAVLSVVADQADRRMWNALHMLAKTAPDAMTKQQDYVLLGAAQDKALAGKAMELTLTGEVPVTVRPSILRVVSATYPEMAFDFALKHKKTIDGWLETSSRGQYYAGLASASKTQEMVGKIRVYSEKYIPATDRGAEERIIAGIEHTIAVREKRMPAVAAWLKQNTK